MKGSTQQEDTTFINIYAPNKSAPKYIKQTLIYVMGEVDNSTIIATAFNPPLTSTNISFRHKINKEMCLK